MLQKTLLTLGRGHTNYAEPTPIPLPFSQTTGRIRFQNEALNQIPFWFFGSYFFAPTKISFLPCTTPRKFQVIFCNHSSIPFKISMSTRYCCMVIRVAIDCKGCYKKLRRTLLNMKEVERQMIEREYNRVSVCGRFRPSDVAIKIRKRMNRRVEILDIQEFDGDASQDQPPPEHQQPPMANGHIVHN